MKKYQFPTNFMWGAAASGPQTEGSSGKVNTNVWETWFAKEPNRFYKQISSSVACDTYNRYKQDVSLMKEIGFNSFRTSIQWSRLIKDFTTGEVCEDAVAFYSDYFKTMQENGIEPIVNLYHFDMPSQLMDEYGGFESKIVVDKFVLYAKQCFKYFGSYIKYFTVFNEPLVPIEFGYFYDAHLPAVRNPKKGIQAAYNSMLAQAKVVECYKKSGCKGEIGTILNLTPAYPRSNHQCDIKASQMCDLIFNKSFMEPSVKGTFPPMLVAELAKFELLPEFDKSELALIKKNTVDFVGLNYYLPRRVQAVRYAINENNPWMPDRYFDKYQMPGSRNNPHRDNNEIYPQAIYDIAMDVKENYGNIKWYLAEIGISITNEEALRDETGMIDDSFRTELLKEHLIELHRAIANGSNCFGVHQWTFIDNWSWLNTHKRRYGFYYLDLKTQQRHIKKHALWFKQLIKDNGF